MMICAPAMLRERTWWLFEAWVLLPLPVALVALLATPLPRAARRRLLWLVERILAVEVRGPLHGLHFMLALTGGSLLAAAPVMLASEAEVDLLADKRDPNVVVMLLSEKFRAERNFWIALCTLGAWLTLCVVHKVHKEKHELRGQLLALQGRGAEAAAEVAFLGRGKEVELAALGASARRGAAAAAVAELLPGGTPPEPEPAGVKKEL